VASVFDIVTSQWLKDRFLLGVDLTLDDGSAYPDGIFEQSIRSAVAWLEQELGIVIDPELVEDEGHDAYEPNRTGFWPFALDRRPVWSVQDLRLRYGSFEAIDLPVSWVRIEDYAHARIHLIPSEDEIGSYSFRSGVPLVAGDVFQPARLIPGYFRFDYTAGFAIHSGQLTVPDGSSDNVVVSGLSPAFLRPNYTTDFTAVSGSAAIKIASRTSSGFTVSVTTPPAGADAVFDYLAYSVPPDILQAIGYKAALLPLDIAGDLIAGAGIASTSTSVDGLSQSINTTSSATNSGYGARVLQFEKELKSLLPALKARFKGVRLATI
jgi:hypothetical protein